MIDFQEIKIDGVALHLVGNKGREEGTRAARELLNFNGENDKFMLLDYFLSSLKLEEFYKLGHDTDLNMNEVFAYCSYIFESPEELYTQSVNILQHLYDKSSHPNVKSGELYVAFFRDVLVDDELVDAVGIFKSEKKDTFLKLQAEDGGDFHLQFEQGSNMNKLDKGCLILNTYRDEGFRVLCVDLRGSEAQYWKDEFLMLTQLQDDSFHTKHYMTMVKEFVQDVVAKDTDRKEQVKLINKVVDYFDKHEQFDYNEFKETAFGGDEEKSKKFDTYKKTYKETEGLFETAEDDGFFIAPTAVKKMKKSFKNLIKLDTQIEIKLNTGSDEVTDEFVERGFDDEKQMFYYKVFFNQEM